MVPANAIITVRVEGTTGGTFPVDVTALRTGVINRLGASFGVIQLSISKGSILSNIATGQWWHWHYSAIVQVQTRGAYASSSDVASIVANAFYVAGGALPSVSVDGVTSQSPGVVESGLSIDGILDQASIALGVSVATIVIGLVAIVAIVAWGPNVKDVARAVS